jgi:hypothetical protein
MAIALVLRRLVYVRSATRRKIAATTRYRRGRDHDQLLLEMGWHLKGLTNMWIVVALEPNRTLVMPSSYSLLTGRSFDPRSDLRPRAYVEGIWGFHLRPAAGGRTRLVIRTRSRSHPRLFARPFRLLVGQSSSVQSCDRWGHRF